LRCGAAERGAEVFDLQKASFLKRASAFLFDGILIGVLAVGFGFLLSLLLNYDGSYARLSGLYDKYEQKYRISFDIADGDYAALDEETLERYEKAYSELNADGEANAAFSMVVYLSLIIITFGVLLAYMALEFVVPLFLKNGQTLGKKIFGIAVMRTDGIRISPLILLIRTLLGKYTIETMTPILVVFLTVFAGLGYIGLVALAGLALLQILLMAFTKTNSAIHDVLARTVVVDLASQMIFDDEQHKRQKLEEYASYNPYG
jgi:uncharacterized RDD family membrane protein YckC